MCAEIIFNLDSNFGWGAATPRILAGGASPPQTPPLTGLAGGRQTPCVFFFASDDTRAARTSGWTSGRTPARPPEPKKLSRCASYDSEYDFTIPFFSQSHLIRCYA